MCLRLNRGPLHLGIAAEIVLNFNCDSNQSEIRPIESPMGSKTRSFYNVEIEGHLPVIWRGFLPGIPLQSGRSLWGWGCRSYPVLCPDDSRPGFRWPDPRFLPPSSPQRAPCNPRSKISSQYSCASVSERFRTISYTQPDVLGTTLSEKRRLAWLARGRGPEIYSRWWIRTFAMQLLAFFLYLILSYTVLYILNTVTYIFYIHYVH
jgi:hypothetical protein